MPTNVTREELPAALVGEMLRMAAIEGRSLAVWRGCMEYKPDMQCYCYFPGGGLAIYDEDIGVFFDKVHAYLKVNP